MFLFVFGWFDTDGVLDVFLDVVYLVHKNPHDFFL